MHPWIQHDSQANTWESYVAKFSGRLATFKLMLRKPPLITEKVKADVTTIAKKLGFSAGAPWTVLAD